MIHCGLQKNATPNGYNRNNSSVPVADPSHLGIAPMCVNCESGPPDTLVICREDCSFHVTKHEIFNKIVSLLYIICREFSHALNP